MSKDAFKDLINTLSFSASGFTQLQASAYIALLKMGEETGSAVASESGINRSKIYDILNQLEDLGAIKKVPRDGKTKYEAIPPDTVLENILEDFRSNVTKSKEALNAVSNLKENIDPEFTSLTTIKLKELSINDFDYIIASHEKGRLMFQDKLSRDEKIGKDIMILDLHHSEKERGLLLIGNNEVVYLFGSPVGETVEALKIENKQISRFINGIIRQDWILDLPQGILEEIEMGHSNVIYVGKSLYMVHTIDGEEKVRFERPTTFLLDDSSIAFIYLGEYGDPKVPLQFITDASIDKNYGIHIKFKMAQGKVGEIRMTTVENPLYLKNLILSLGKKEKQLADMRKRLSQ